MMQCAEWNYGSDEGLTAALTLLSDVRGLPAVRCWNAPLAP